jgi:superfamily II DNA or RNA helicase
MLTPEAAKHGTFYLLRGSLRDYQNKALHAWIAHFATLDEDDPLRSAHILC